MRTPVLVAVGLATLTCATAATAKTIDKGTASGDYAIATASGEVENPKTIKVKVTSTPRQKVRVYWTMVCSRGLNAGSKSGSFNAKTPLSRALKKPMGNADSCIVSANASLDRGGKVTIAILG